MDDIVRRIGRNIKQAGYHYEPSFPGAGDGRHVIELARKLGPAYIPDGLPSDYPAVVSQPAGNAPPWRPFDRSEAIGWHNDFSTFPHRPQLSLLWIAAADPGGPERGDWRVASVEDVLVRLKTAVGGRALVRRMRSEPLPFGYEGGDVSFFRLVEPAEHGEDGLRFYRRALWEGARIYWGQVPPRVRELTDRVAQAADATGEVLHSREGALLVVDNRRSLHDRLPQSVRGDDLRRSILCFVQKLV